jgi:hypothetical protein
MRRFSFTSRGMVEDADGFWINAEEVLLRNVHRAESGLAWDLLSLRKPGATKENNIIDRAIAALSTSPPLTDSQREAGRWVPWKTGDAMPPDGVYWTTRIRDGRPYCIESEVAADAVRGWWPTEYQRKVSAYWSIPLPPPYTGKEPQP